MKSKSKRVYRLQDLIFLRIKTHIALIFGLIFVLYMVWPSLNPFNGGMFSFHDPTQPGRVTSFVQSLKSGHIPPRIAPEYSFNLGFPVFNYYAPTAYWITSLIAVLGISSSTAVKVSFLMTVVISFLGMYYFLTKLFQTPQHFSALIGAAVYVTSTYFATEIIIRGNLAETWFLALLPLSLGLVIENSRRENRWLELFTTVVFALLFTSHNMMMLFAIPVVIIFILFHPNRLKNVMLFCLALLIDSYFFIPAFVESDFVQASTIAKEYDYSAHFLCPWQLWTSNGWDFGGSAAGCETDTMSFKIGKLQMITGMLGMGVFLAQVVSKIKKFSLRTNYNSKFLVLLFILIITLGSLFLTLEISKFIWTFFSSVMALFQFPWRFIVFGVFGMAVFSGYLINWVKLPFQKFILFGLYILLFFPAKKYFIKPLIPLSEYTQQFDSEEYRKNHLAFKMPEYIAKDVDTAYWRSLEPRQDQLSPLIPDRPVQFEGNYQVLKLTPFSKHIRFTHSGDVVVNIHYFPFWKLAINRKQMFPEMVDKLGRPVVKVQAGDELIVRYEQTFVEKVANAVTLLGIMLLGIVFKYKALKLQPILNRFVH